MTHLAILATLVVLFSACASERKFPALGSDANEEEAKDVLSVLKRTFSDFQDDSRRKRSADANLRPLNDAEDDMIKRDFDLKDILDDLKQETRRRRSDADESSGEKTLDKRTLNLKRMLEDLKHEQKRTDAELETGSGSAPEPEKRAWNLNQMLDGDAEEGGSGSIKRALNLNQNVNFDDGEIAAGSGGSSGSQSKRKLNLKRMLGNLQQNVLGDAQLELEAGSGDIKDKRALYSNQMLEDLKRAQKRSDAELETAIGSETEKRAWNLNQMPDFGGLYDSVPAKRGSDESSDASSGGGDSDEAVDLEKVFRPKRQITALTNLEIAEDDAKINLTLQADKKISVETAAVRMEDDEVSQLVANTRQIFIVQPLLIAETGNGRNSKNPTTLHDRRMQAKMSKLASSDTTTFVDRHYNIVVVLSVLGTLVALAMFVALFYCVTHLSPRADSRAITTTKA